MNFYGINSHSSFAIRLQYDELGLFIIIRPGCQKQLYCSPKTGCKITCLCAASIKMELLLLLEFRGVLFYSCGQSGITVSASFSFPQSHSYRGSSGRANWGWLCTEPEEPQKWGFWSSLAQDPSPIGLESTPDQLSHDFTQLSLHGQ